MYQSIEIGTSDLRQHVRAHKDIIGARKRYYVSEGEYLSMRDTSRPCVHFHVDEAPLSLTEATEFLKKQGEIGENDIVTGIWLGEPDIQGKIGAVAALNGETGQTEPRHHKSQDDLYSWKRISGWNDEEGHGMHISFF
jgi:hypothetical protein